MSIGEINLTPLLQAIIAFLATWITTRMIPWIKSKVTAEQMKSIKDFIEISAKAAEQMKEYNNGESKKEYVLYSAIDFLSSKGLILDKDITREQLNALIEAAVYAMNHDNANNSTSLINKEEV